MPTSKKSRPASKSKDIINKEFGMLTVIAFDRIEKGRTYYWCQCQCGNIKSIRRYSFDGGKTISCGCSRRRKEPLPIKRPHKYNIDKDFLIQEYQINNKSPKEIAIIVGCSERTIVDRIKEFDILKSEYKIQKELGYLANQEFGHLIVLYKVERPIPKTKDKGIYYLCRCKCGNECVKQGKVLQSNPNISCGCKRYDNMPKRENHHNFNPDKTDEERIKKRLELDNVYFKIKKDTLQRDNYTCQVCERRGGKLIMHHKDGWHWCRDRRYELDNLVILCPQCHKNFHSKYGIKNNTEEQFDEFWNCHQRKIWSSILQESL